MDRRPAPEAERLLGGSLSDDDDNLLDNGHLTVESNDTRELVKQENNYSARKLRK